MKSNIGSFLNSRCNKELSDLSEAHELLIDSLDNLISSVKSKAKSAIDNSDLDESRKILDYVSEIENSKNIIIKSMDKFINKETKDSHSSIESNRQKSDFHSSIHSELDFNDLSFTIVTKLIIENKSYYAKNWSNFLVFVCDHLIKKDHERFLELTRHPEFTHRRRDIFNKNAVRMKDPKKLINGYYIETNYDANTLYKFALIFLEGYGLTPGDDYVIEFKKRD